MVTHESRIWLRKDEPITVDKNILKIPAYYPDIPVVRNDIAIKYSNIQEMDRQVGEIISDLEQDNLLDKTIIFFWSDHGGNLLRQKRAVGNSGLISRYYTVQHCLRGPAKYEFVFTNPTSRKVKITPRISYSPRKWLAGNFFSINSLGSHTYVLDVKENEKAYVKFKSRLCLSRPVVFRISNNSMDVFHG